MKLTIICLFVQVIILIVVSGQSNIPEYLAIQANTSQAKQPVFDFLKRSFERLIFQYPEDYDTIIQDYKALFSKDGVQLPWNYPDSWHITVLYIGTNYSEMNTSYYTNFVPGESIPIITYAMAYVPQKIICGPTFPKGIEIQNQCPHVTLMMGEWPAVNSNSVLEALFTNNGPLENQYNKGDFDKKDFLIWKKFKNMTIEGEQVTVYLMKCGLELNLPAVTTYEYANNETLFL